MKHIIVSKKIWSSAKGSYETKDRSNDTEIQLCMQAQIKKQLFYILVIFHNITALMSIINFFQSILNLRLLVYVEIHVSCKGIRNVYTCMCSILWTQISLRSGLVHNHASVLNCYRCVNGHTWRTAVCIWMFWTYKVSRGSCCNVTDCPETGDIIYNTKTGPDLLCRVWRRHSLHLHEESNPRMQFCEEKKWAKKWEILIFSHFLSIWYALVHYLLYIILEYFSFCLVTC